MGGSPLLFGVQAVIWPRVARKSGTRYPGGSSTGRGASLRDGTGARRRRAGYTARSRERQEQRQGETGGGGTAVIQLYE